MSRSPGCRHDFETRIAGCRILEKGAEVDLHTTVEVDGRRVWESLNAVYYRGKFGEASEGGISKGPLHPQMIVGQCMARLQAPETGHPQSLDLWLKGPVYFDSDVALCARRRSWNRVRADGARRSAAGNPGSLGQRPTIPRSTSVPIATATARLERSYCCRFPRYSPGSSADGTPVPHEHRLAECSIRCIGSPVQGDGPAARYRLRGAIGI